MSIRPPQSRVLAALASLNVDGSGSSNSKAVKDVQPSSNVLQRTISDAYTTKSSKPIAPPLKSARSAPLPTKPAETPSRPLYSYSTITPTPRVLFATTDTEADTWIEQLNLTGPISVDCEWVVNFRRGPGGANIRPVSLIQIADQKTIILIQLRNSERTMTRFPRALRRVLEDSTILKAGANILNDAKKLFKDYGVLTEGVVELGSLARQADPSCSTEFGNGKRPVSLAKLVARYLNKELNKDSNVRVSNWENPKLPPTMLEYAANDAYSGYQVFARLLTLAEQAEIALDKTKFVAGVGYPTLAVPTPKPTAQVPIEELPPVPQLHLMPDMSAAGVKLYHIRAYRYWALGKRTVDNMCQELRIDKQAGPLARSTVISYIVTALTQWPSKPFMPVDLGELRLLLLEDLSSWQRHYEWYTTLAGIES
ncbi:Nuclear transport factor 2 [Mycena indigotica]|uniref:Nuclear transport factor 2 n=1 Tax=Mycena indigotica TaxID=2126181 RepID=A0A8H6T7H0_9AGAR|nr:Nuclear transport factor 2 [Mycena indigotica]KAF7312199.1 Nuclear transport factor 2 [Mycena indigotica]